MTTDCDKLLNVENIEIKKDVESLAIFGGKPLFNVPRSTSNLLKPDVEKFLAYSREFYEAEQYTNNGPVARKLEKRLAVFHDVEYCVLFSSGFWAIALAMHCLALDGRNEVIMPSLTYRRMADIAAWLPLKPHYCEVDSETLAMTAQTVEACINDKTALILGTHPIVNCCDAKALEDVSRKYGIPLLFDSVESVYETLPDGRIGSFGEAECFSLHACKLLNGFGGGYLTTNNGKLAKQLMALRSFGFTGQDTIGFPGGLNAKLNEIHAAMALASLDDIDQQIKLNKERYTTYKKLMNKIPGIRILSFDEQQKCGFKNIVVELTREWRLSRNVTLQVLNAENILARAHYAPPLHQKAAHINHLAPDLTLTEKLAERFLNMPCGQRVSIKDIEDIAKVMQFLYSNAEPVSKRIQGNL